MQLSNAPILTDRKFKELSFLIETSLGIKMPPSKKTLIESRLYKRLRELAIDTFEEYCDLLNGPFNEQELPFLFDAITTNKTDFYRESDHFDYLSRVILPDLLKKYNKMNYFWSAASSSGEEAYTMAFVLHDYMQAKGENFKYRILGTDISNNVLSTARKGIYNQASLAGIPKSTVSKYFLKGKDPQSGSFRVKPEIRSSIMFYRMNLIEDSYKVQHKFPVIFCRNVLIYFEKHNQEKVINNLINHMDDDGYLFLGHSESITGLDVPLKSVYPSIYRKKYHGKK